MSRSAGGERRIGGPADYQVGDGGVGAEGFGDEVGAGIGQLGMEEPRRKQPGRDGDPAIALTRAHGSDDLSDRG